MIIVIRNSLRPGVPEWIKAVSSGDDNDGVTADNGRTTDWKIASCKHHALPRELVLLSILTDSNYPSVGHSTAYSLDLFELNFELETSRLKYPSLLGLFVLTCSVC